MNIEELKNILSKTPYADGYCSIDDGLSAPINLWSCHGFYSVVEMGDRGEPYYLGEHLSEDAACHLMLEYFEKYISMFHPDAYLTLDERIKRLKNSPFHSEQREKTYGRYKELIQDERYTLQDDGIYSNDLKELIRVNPLHEYEFIVIQGVTQIHKEAFSNCDFISEIQLPEGLLSIGDQAFGPCPNLDKINIPISVTNFGNYIFIASGRVKIQVGCGMIEQYKKIPQIAAASRHMIEK